MLLRHINLKGIARKVIMMIIAAGLTFNATARADSNRPDQEPTYPKTGRTIAKMPPGHDTVIVGSKRYHYHDGVYYRQGPKGFSVVKPPRGARINRLPSGFETLVIAGITYFLFAGVYYQKGPAGYTVVDQPDLQSPAVDSATSDRDARNHICVNVDILNVRSGPGMNHAVVGKVHMGDVLPVRDNAPGWYYVRLNDGRYGWVMARYTYTKPANAKG